MQDVRIWDASKFTAIDQISMAFDVESASYCPERGLIAAGGQDMWVHLVKRTGEEVDISKGHHGPVHTVRFSPGGATYASGSEDGTIRIWETVSPSS